MTSLPGPGGMASQQQNYNNTGVPLLASLFLLVTVILCVVVSRSVVPRFGLGGKMLTAKKAMIAFCAFQTVMGYFFTFSDLQPYAMMLTYTPLMGIFSYSSVDPPFLLLFSILTIWELQFMQVGESELTARGCDLFGSPGYRFCENGWVTFLMLMSTLYQYFMYLQIFTSFFLFSHCHSGHASDYVPPEPKDPTDAPLLHDAEDVPAPVYEVESAAAGGYQSGATGGYQQDSKVPF